MADILTAALFTALLVAIGVLPFIVMDSTWRRAWVNAGGRSQIISRQLHAIERRVIILDDLADVQPELLQRGALLPVFS